MRHPARSFDFDTLYQQMEEAVADGLVRENTLGPLRIYCYTPECVYSSAWNDITRMARGLIVDIESRSIIATPFVKFFNLHEISESLPDSAFEVFEKLDGSLITLFFHDGRWRTATKGHLSSPQARWAEEWIKAHDLSALTPGTTYLCEAIYPKNRIVIRYQKAGLSFLAAYDHEGHEIIYDTLANLAKVLQWDITNRLDFSSLSELISTAKTLPVTKEGFILRFANGYRIKVKGEEYCRIHRLISNCTPLAVWEYWQTGKDPMEMRRELPEEFWPDFDCILFRLTDRRETIQNRIRELADSLQSLPDKDVGIRLPTLPEDLRNYIFSYRKAGGNFESAKLRESIFRRIRPVGNALDGYVPSSALHRIQAETP